MMTLYIFFCVLIILGLGLGLEDKVDSIDNKNNGMTDSNKRNDIESLKKLFYERRKKHLSAVRNIKHVESYEQRYKMISMIIGEMIQIIEMKKKIIERVNDELKRNSTSSLSDGNIKDALLSVCENTALFGEIILENPDITHRILKKEKSWYEILKWSLTFVDENPLILDQSTIETLKLVLQELNLVARSSEYSNPNWTKSSEKNLIDSNEKQKKSKKTKRKPGPQIVHIDL